MTISREVVRPSRIAACISGMDASTTLKDARGAGAGAGAVQAAAVTAAVSTTGRLWWNRITFGCPRVDG